MKCCVCNSVLSNNGYVSLKNIISIEGSWYVRCKCGNSEMFHELNQAYHSFKRAEKETLKQKGAL